MTCTGEYRTPLGCSNTQSRQEKTIQNALDFYMEQYKEMLRVHPAAHEVLNSLQVTHVLGLVTNFAYSPGAYRILDRFSLRPFHAVVVSGEDGLKKPSRHIFEVALEQLEVKPNEAAFVGDESETDISGAAGIGMKTILLSKDPKKIAGPGACISSLEQFPTLELLNCLGNVSVTTARS